MRVLRPVVAAMVVLCFQTLCYSQVMTGSGQALVPNPLEKTSTQQLFAQATASWPACGMWHPSGICFFIICFIGCHIKTSDRYSHMRPDLVVSTYPDLDNHPWPLLGIPIGQATLRASSTLMRAMIGDSAGSRVRETRVEKNVRFRDGDALGHPGGTFVAPGMICEGASTPFTPYYQSFADAASWRNFLPTDMLRPESWVPGLGEIGNFPLNTWGNVFPRTGWHTHQHDVKVGAVLSQRIADIVTNPGQPRVYQYLKSGGMSQRHGQTVFDPPPAMPNNLLGGQWQISAPMQGAVVTACTPFGLNDSAGPASYGDGMTSSSQAYAFTLWRPYACCQTKGAFLFSIVWGMW